MRWMPLHRQCMHVTYYRKGSNRCMVHPFNVFVPRSPPQTVHAYDLLPQTCAGCHYTDSFHGVWGRGGGRGGGEGASFGFYLTGRLFNLSTVQCFSCSAFFQLVNVFILFSLSTRQACYMRCKRVALCVTRTGGMRPGGGRPCVSATCICLCLLETCVFFRH